MGRYCVKVTVRNGGGGRKNKKFSRSAMERRNTLPGRKSNSPCGEFRSRKENHSDATFAPVACIRSLRRGQNTRRCFPFRKFSKLSPVQTGIFLFLLDDSLSEERLYTKWIRKKGNAYEIRLTFSFLRQSRYKLDPLYHR